MWPSFSQWIKRTDTMGHFQAWPPQTLLCLTHGVLSFSWPLSGHIRIWKKFGLLDDLLEGCGWCETHLEDFEWEMTRLLCETMGLQLALPTRYRVLSIADFSFYQDFLRWLYDSRFTYGETEACQEHQGAQLGSSQTEGFHQVWQILYIFTTIKKKEFKKKQWSSDTAIM